MLRTLAVVLLALLVPVAPARAQSSPGDYTDLRTMPEGPHKARVEEYLDVVGAGDAERLEAFFREALAPSLLDAIPLEDHVGAHQAYLEENRGFDLYGVRRYTSGPTPHREVVIVRSRLTEAWQGIVLEFEPTPPHRITSIELSPARPPKDVPPEPPVTREGLGADLDAFLDRLAEAEAFSGSVLLARDGQVLYEGVRGLADRNHGVPNTLDTKFNLGSMNKMFTAVVVGQLVDEGRLRFEDTVDRWLGGKGWTKADLSKVRVEHLLTHTAGFGSYFNETYDRSARQLFRRVDDYKPLLAEETLAFEPGSRFQYSNSGFLLLGAVIEAVTGQDYFDTVRERIYARAGMPNSDCYDLDLVVRDLAIGYSREKTPTGVQWRNNTFAHVIRGGPAGGGYSTAPDLLAFAEALRGEPLVSPATLERLWTPGEAEGSRGYGYGFGLGESPAGRIAGHGGGFQGISSNLEIYRDTGYVAVVLSNQDGASRPLEARLRSLIGRLRGP